MVGAWSAVAVGIVVVVTNPQMKKGNKAAEDVAVYLRRVGFPHAERRVQHGSKDLGDITGIDGVVIEVKNQRRLALAGYLDEAEVERSNAGEAAGVVWHKRARKGSPKEWYVTMDGETFVLFLQLLTTPTERNT